MVPNIYLDITIYLLIKILKWPLKILINGVIGIVSSKITDMYFKPSILICMEEEEGKGSGRSIPGFDLHNALCKTSKYLQKYGGHEMAVGLSLYKNNFEID